MKRVLAVVLVVLLMCANAALGEVNADSVCQAIVRQVKSSFDGNETFDAVPYYSTSPNEIVLDLTSKKNDHSFFVNKRAANDIQPLYDMFANFNFYSECRTCLDEYSIEGFDIYLLMNSSDGYLEYFEINGRNVIDILSGPTYTNSDSDEGITALACEELARQLEASFDGVENLTAASYYDAALNVLVLGITTVEYDHAFFTDRRAANDIQPLYDLVEDLDFYSVCVNNLDKFSIKGVDVYLFLYSSDGVLEYGQVNGRDITYSFLRLATTLTGRQNK